MKTRFYNHLRFQYTSPSFIQTATCLFRDFLPSLSQSVDGAIDEGGADLQHSVVVVHTATDISHCCPLLNRRSSIVDVWPANYLRHYQTAGLYSTANARRQLPYNTN